MVIFIKSSLFRGLPRSNKKWKRSEIFMVYRSISGLSTVEILESYHVLISSYEVSKVAKKLPIFIYWTIDKVLTAVYFETKIL
jgi:hypothetical protein